MTALSQYLPCSVLLQRGVHDFKAMWLPSHSAGMTWPRRARVLLTHFRFLKAWPRSEQSRLHSVHSDHAVQLDRNTTVIGIKLNSYPSLPPFLPTSLFIYHWHQPFSQVGPLQYWLQMQRLKGDLISRPPFLHFTDCICCN